jgi:hypothetical protein
MGKLVQAASWHLPDELWQHMEVLLLERPKHPLGCHSGHGEVEGALSRTKFLIIAALSHRTSGHCPYR